MSTYLAVQKALYLKLTGSSVLASLLASDPIGGSPTLPAVFDYTPQAQSSEDDSFFPYVVLGADTAVEADTDDVNGIELTSTIHVWDRNQGRARCKQVMDAIYAVLHTASLSLVNGTAIYCFWEFAESIPDADPLVQHGVLRFRIMTQDL